MKKSTQIVWAIFPEGKPRIVCHRAKKAWRLAYANANAPCYVRMTLFGGRSGQEEKKVRTWQMRKSQPWNPKKIKSQHKGTCAGSES